MSLPATRPKSLVNCLLLLELLELLALLQGLSRIRNPQTRTCLSASLFVLRTDLRRKSRRERMAPYGPPTRLLSDSKIGNLRMMSHFTND